VDLLVAQGLPIRGAGKSTEKGAEKAGELEQRRRQTPAGNRIRRGKALFCRPFGELVSPLKGKLDPG